MHTTSTSQPHSIEPPGSWVSRLGAIGDRPEDSREVRLHHRFLVYMGVLMSAGGVFWSGLSVYFGLLLPGLIPAGYVVLTALNLTYFRLSKDFVRTRFFQVGMSLLLPFLFQWVLGGFAPSGAVMIWSLLSIAGALTFTESRLILRWLAVYSLLAIFSGLLDSYFRSRFDVHATPDTSVVFFVVNVVMVSNVTFGLMLYLLGQRDKLQLALASAREKIGNLRQEVSEARKLGQYTLERKLGEGGMGVVYRASHALLRRPTAIKLLPPDKLGEQSVKRFEREVRLTARLTHPNTVTIFDYGRTPDGIFYYAMELLEGATLADVVAVDGPQSPARVIHILQQAAGALYEAHQAGLIHRDIKPANMMLCEQGCQLDVIKVLDFGLVKNVDPETRASGMTQEHAVGGTPAYLAPETMTDPEGIDHRVDLYALGAVGYFLLTGKDVFEGRSTADVAAHHIYTRPVPPTERSGREIPADLERLVLSCLSKRPADRPADARALREQLSACADHGGWTERDARAWWDRCSALLGARQQHGSGSTSHATLDVDLAKRLDPKMGVEATLEAAGAIAAEPSVSSSGGRRS